MELPCHLLLNFMMQPLTIPGQMIYRGLSSKNHAAWWAQYPERYHGASTEMNGVRKESAVGTLLLNRAGAMLT